MRVLHWHRNYLGGGAVAHAVRGLAAAEAHAGLDVTVCAATRAGPPLYGSMDRSDGLRLVTWQPGGLVRPNGPSVSWPTRSERFWLRALRPDIVHIHGEFVVDNLWVPRIFECPIILSPHGAFHPVALRKGRRIRRNAYIRMATKMLYERVAAFHALSPMEHAHIGRLVAGKRVYCVPQGPGAEPAPAGRQTPPVDPPTLLFVGRLDVYTKGLDIFLEAFADAARLAGMKRARVILAGPDWNGGLAILRRRADELGIGGRVVFPGLLHRTQVGALFHQCDIYVHVSRHEGFPLSVAEALVAGLPAILSDAIGTVSYPEVRTWEHVSVIAPQPRIVAGAIADFARRLPELRQTATATAAAVRQFFSWPRIAGQHIETYEQLAGRGTRN